MYHKIACMQNVKRITAIQYGWNRMLIVKVMMRNVILFKIVLSREEHILWYQELKEVGVSKLQNRKSDVAQQLSPESFKNHPEWLVIQPS